MHVYSLLKGRKKAVQPSVMISLLSALCSLKTLTGRSDALLHTVDLQGLCFTTVVVILCLSLVTFVWFVKMYRTV